MKNKQYKKEVKEAIEACDNVIRALDNAKRSLNIAQGLGVFDLMGGKLLASLVKQNRINKAERDILKAQRAIKIMNEEVLDVESIMDVNLEMGTLLKLADYFFGGPIADWIVLGRLVEGKKKVAQAKRDALQIRNNLERLL